MNKTEPTTNDDATADDDAAGAVIAYHQRTKHRLDGYAAGPDTLDWDDQPDPFRDYGDCPCEALPLATGGPGFPALAAGERQPVAQLGRNSLGALLSASLAISSWKHYGTSRWAVRCNPSSGNLHPTECYLVMPDNTDLDAGVWHYRPQDHQLEQRCAHAEDVSNALFDGLPAGSCLLGLSAIPWREAWKYGERAWRYCQLDLGHALGALRYAAALLGWQVIPLDHLADEAVAALLGLDRAQDYEADEPEYPELLCLLVPIGAEVPSSYTLPDALPPRPWQGRANRLSGRHLYQWPLVDEVVGAAQKPLTVQSASPAAALPAPPFFDIALSALDLIQRRRSAQAMDGQTGMSKSDFFRLLDHLLPRSGLPPWGEQPDPAHVHLVLFVHRVEGLQKGLYVLPRHPCAMDGLRSALRAEFQWQDVEDAPAHLPLKLLVAADARKTAARLGCQQGIASDGVFSLAMLGEFDAAMAEGPWGYRTLMTEAGLLGQALYLGAEASDLQGTGIGCFFDDALHELFGLHDSRYQVLYQFTVGKGQTDLRISSQRPYPELRNPTA